MTLIVPRSTHSSIKIVCVIGDGRRTLFANFFICNTNSIANNTALMITSVENDNNGATEAPNETERSQNDSAQPAETAHPSTGTGVPSVLPASTWYRKLDSAEDHLTNVNNYRAIAKFGGLDGKGYSVGGVAGVFHYREDDVSAHDLAALATIVLHLKKDLQQYSKDKFKQQCLQDAVSYKILTKKVDDFEELLKELGTLTKEEVISKMHQINAMCTVTGDFVRKAFCEFEQEHTINVQITDEYYGYRACKEHRLTRPQKNWSGHSGYFIMQESAGEVVKEVRSAMASGSAKTTVNRRVKRAIEVGNDTSSNKQKKRPPHTPVILDLTGEYDPIVVQQTIRPAVTRNPTQTMQLNEIAKKFSLSPMLKETFFTVINGTYGAYFPFGVLNNDSLIQTL